MNYTEEMERAMSQRHQMSFADYENKLSNQLKVEKRRELEHQACNNIVAKFDSQIPK